MAHFKVVYPGGLTDHESVEDCDTVEAFANRKFGSVDYTEHGVTIEMTEVYPDGGEPTTDAKPVSGDTEKPIETVVLNAATQADFENAAGVAAEVSAVRPGSNSADMQAAVPTGDEQGNV